ncbi:MAG: hypothetical protein GC152_06210 [Alphaproteobacteria bacterium]|nr:hypothetical protein [Alphaproteobacteria bacterium]
MTPIGDIAGTAINAAAENRRVFDAASRTENRNQPTPDAGRSAYAETKDRVDVSPDARGLREDSGAARDLGRDRFASGDIEPFIEDSRASASRGPAPRSIGDLENAFARNAAAFQQSEARRSIDAIEIANERPQQKEGLAFDQAVE